MRLALLRSAVVTAVLGGAVLVPTAAFAESLGHADPASAAAPAQEQGQVQVHAPAPVTYRTGSRSDSQERPATAASDGISANPYFLIAGGAMAAAGAAGLVYSTVRRGRADG
ncbi:hypothetical protein [Streptomyces sp. NPDC006552]|uniref:hypothetical protein n=1 Tax=Streptomyces sp. NPDC006552 TaxID=3157179 RepID=UPI0033B07D41